MSWMYYTIAILQNLHQYCQSQPQLNSISTQIKAEVSFILRQIQPPTNPSRVVVKLDLSVAKLRLNSPQLNFNSN